MKERKIGLRYKGRKIELDLRVCNWFTKFSGLMFTKKNNAKALLFEFKKPVEISIHSYFVFFPFWTIWVDEENKIIDLKLVKSFSSLIKPKKPFVKLIEIPVNKKYSEIIKLLVGD